MLLSCVVKHLKHWHEVSKTLFKLSFKLWIIEVVEANSHIMCMEIAKHFGMVSSLLGNIFLTKYKMKEVGMKCGVQAAKKRGGENMKAGG